MEKKGTATKRGRAKKVLRANSKETEWRRKSYPDMKGGRDPTSRHTDHTNQNMGRESRDSHVITGGGVVGGRREGKILPDLPRKMSSRP